MSARCYFKLFQYLSFTLLSACGGVQSPNIKENLNSSAINSQSSLIDTQTEHLYRIKKGDTLYKIAKAHHLNYKKLALWNNIAPPYTIHVNDTLRLTLKKNETAVTNTASQSAKRNTPINPFSTPWFWPTKGLLVQNSQNNELKGIKISGKLSQPIYSSQKGKVVYRGKGLRGYGKLIIVKHEHRYISTYGFNEKILVKEGDIIKKGDKIAEMGLSNGQPLLYFEIRHNGKSLNPLTLLPNNN